MVTNNEKANKRGLNSCGNSWETPKTEKWSAGRGYMGDVIKFIENYDPVYDEAFNNCQRFAK